MPRQSTVLKGYRLSWANVTSSQKTANLPGTTDLDLGYMAHSLVG